MGSSQWQIDKNIETLSHELNDLFKAYMKKSTTASYENNKDKHPELYISNYCKIQEELTDFFITLYTNDEIEKIMDDINNIVEKNKMKFNIAKMIEDDPELGNLFG